MLGKKKIHLIDVIVITLVGSLQTYLKHFSFFYHFELSQNSIALLTGLKVGHDRKSVRTL